MKDIFEVKMSTAVVFHPKAARSVIIISVIGDKVSSFLIFLLTRLLYNIHSIVTAMLMHQLNYNILSFSWRCAAMLLLQTWQHVYRRDCNISHQMHTREQGGKTGLLNRSYATKKRIHIACFSKKQKHIFIIVFKDKI